MFNALFFIILALFAVQLMGAVRQWDINNQSPRITVEATVYALHTDTQLQQTPVAGDITGAHGYSTSTSTSYRAVFRTADGEEHSFLLNHAQYAVLEENMCGRLTHQGTRYMSFEPYS